MTLIIFPHQLFLDHPGFELQPERIALIEDSLFFGDEHYPAHFHKQKLWLHRATMKRFEAWVKDELGIATQYLEYDSKPGLLERQLRAVKSPGAQLIVCDPNDFILEKRINRISYRLSLELDVLPTPNFINSSQVNRDYRAAKKRWFMADFYKFQRQRLDVLMKGDEPIGGKWSFDEENRKKVPKKLVSEIPTLPNIQRDEFDREAVKYVTKKFPTHPGSIDQLYYPTSHSQAEAWLESFLKIRFGHFGAYEDAIVEGESWLWHSVLTPMLNVGLLSPAQILQKTLQHADENEVPLNSLEGFIRQIIGWREFVRATYCDAGVEMRTSNHWEHHRRIPQSFYDGTTGVRPIDDVITRILETGYCHHIERLMVLGGFMFLCEFHPDEIYRWFMEMFVDSYDWVMVPNVYSMSQHADGGLITTKPYFSGSSYIRKMSHYKTEPWCEIWDGLYWRWIWLHHEDLSKNPRWAMMCSMAKKMDKKKRDQHLENADRFLSQIDESIATPVE